MNRIVLILILLVVVLSGYSQKKWQKDGKHIVPPVCYASDKVEKSYVPVDPEILKRLKSAETKSNISVSYTLFPNDAKKAFEHAVSIWETVIESPVTIYLQANWRRMDQNVLGSCGPSDYLTNFEKIPQEGRYYPISVVEKITKTEMTGPTEPDMLATFNRDIDWYFGTDGNTPTALYDFVTVALHEIGHGLGFSGFFYINDRDEGAYEYFSQEPAAAAFDVLVEKADGVQLTNTNVFQNPSEELADAFESGQLYTNSQEATSANSGTRPRLYAPFNWNDGSSIYHLNDATFPTGNPNSLMTHAFGKGESVHSIGSITTGIMADIGWKNLFIRFNELKDKEEVTPLSFNVYIESDYDLDTSALFVVYSNDGFQNHIDSTALITSGENNFSTEIIPPDDASSVHYYISATDEKTRTFRKPIEAPNLVYSVRFGPDTENPEIEHNPIDYFFTADGELSLTANVSDNLGIDTVYVEYAINGSPIQTFGLKHMNNLVYSGKFNFNNNTLNDGDEISYNIVAVDASLAHNSARFPEEGELSFNIDKLLEPVGGYINDFETSLSDFVLSDFDIYLETNFDNNALHSPHPYPSPEIDDSVFNLTSVLKHPIILKQGGMMSYDQIVLIETGTSGTEFGDDEFWDYVIVEGSKNEGDTWFPLADGYDSSEDSLWNAEYNKTVIAQASSATGVPEWYIKKEINLTENENFSAGDTILIRFRLYSDPYAYGWGWAIDNLRIQFPVSSGLQVLSPGNILVYPNPFKNSFKAKITPKTTVSNVKIDLFNMFGQNIRSLYHPLESSQFIREINMDGFADGIYLLSVRENGQQIFTKKIIKD